MRVISFNYELSECILCVDRCADFINLFLCILIFNIIQENHQMISYTRTPTFLSSFVFLIFFYIGAMQLQETI